MIQRRHDLTLLLVGIAVIALVVLNSLLYFARFDLTGSGAYTISPVTKKLFDKVDQPVRITYYVSGKLKNAEPQLQHISDLLEEYARLSGGKIQVQVINPDGKEQELGLENYGIQPLQLQVNENSQQSVALVYSGVRIDYLNSYKVLAVVTDPGTIEYEVTSTITGMIEKKTKVLGLLVGSADQDTQNPLNDYSYFTQQTSKNFELRRLVSGEPIPGDVDVLFVLKEQDLKPIDAFYIDQFLMGGKGVLVGLETVGVDLTRGIQPAPLPKGPVRSLLENYGITYQDGWLLDDINRPIVVPQQVGQIQVQQLVRYPVWLSVPPQNMSAENPITARGSGLDLFWGSPITLKEGVDAEVLAHTSNHAILLKQPQAGDPQQIAALFANSNEPKTQYNVAVLRKGKIDSAFVGKDLKTLFPELKTDKTISSVANGRLVAVGDSDIAGGLVPWIQQISEASGNVVFLQNAFDWLGNSPDMLELRTRLVEDTRLNVITDPNARNAVGSIAWVVNVVLVPAILIVVGVIRFVRRRQATRTEAQ